MNVSEAYTVLGLPPHSGQADVKKAYKSLAKIHHPDKGGNVDKFHRVKEAFDLLSRSGGKGGSDINMDDIFSTLFRGARPFKKYARQKVHLPEMLVSLKMAYNGGTVTKNIGVQIPCKKCSGLGRGGSECPYCKGMGYSQTQQRRHFVNTDICSYCAGTGFSEKCPDCSGKGVKWDVQEMLVHLHPNTPDGAVLGVQSTGMHKKVRIRIQVPDHYRVVSNHILYTPPVELLEVMKGYKLDVLGREIEVKPFHFGDIQVDEAILVRPEIQVADETVFDKVIN